MKRPLLAALTVFLISNLVTVPWAIRNYRCFHAFVQYNTASTRDLYGCLNTSIKDVRICSTPSKGDPDYAPDYMKALEDKNEKAVSWISKREIIKYLIHHPDHFIRNGIQKEFYFLYPLLDKSCFPAALLMNNPYQVSWIFILPNIEQKAVWPIDLIQESTKRTAGFSWVNWPVYAERMAALVFYWVIFWLSLPGIVIIISEWRALMPAQRIGIIVLGLSVGFYLSEQFIIYPEVKYRFPLEPFFMILTAIFIAKITEKKR